MNYLTALLAFAAVMIVLSTLATVVVEGLHKMAGKRAKDFHGMLTKLYEDVIQTRLEEKVPANALTAKAHEFADQLRKNPAFQNTARGFLERIPFVKDWFKSDFEELTTRQFAEQLAQTEFGKHLQQQSTETIKSTLDVLSYQFERYGEAASQFFLGRARVLSVLVAFVLALSLNVDAIKLYRSLARDTSLSDKVITSLDIAKLEQAYLEKIQTAGNENQKNTVKDEYNEVLESMRHESQRLEGLGLPIGHGYFPYCASNLASTPNGTLKDSRCKGIKPYEEFKTPLIGPITTWLYAFFASMGSRVVGTQDGIAWLFSVLLTGGLIGLGAPFWFRAYRFIANFIPSIKLSESILGRKKKTAGENADKTSQDKDGLSPDDLLEAFVKSKST